MMNDRKRQVLLTAQRIFTEKGFASTSVQEILDESGISKGTFYNYFTSKNECLKAILEHGHDEAKVRRRELLIGQDPTDKTILAEQLVVRLLVHREQKLLPILESIFLSGDDELRNYVKKMMLAEFTWLKTRLVDVYGKDAEPYAADCTLLLFGMMQQILHISSAHTKEEVNVNKLAHYLFRRMDSIIADMIRTKDVFLEEDVFSELGGRAEEEPISKGELLKRLAGFLELLGNDSKPASKQYVQFLLDELNTETPRIFVLESVVQSFREGFLGTSHASESRELANKVWRYMDTIRKDGPGR